MFPRFLSRVVHWQRRCIPWAPIIMGSVVACTGCEEIPERYVVASTPHVAGEAVETHVSHDGHFWSGPGKARDINGLPIAAMEGVPPGIGSNTAGYKLAFFDATGTLHTQDSEDGLDWSNDQTHGAFPVDPKSRPAVTFDYDNQQWIVAFRETDGDVFVLRVEPSGGTPIQLSNVTTVTAVAFAWANNRYVLCFKSGTNLLAITASNVADLPVATPAVTGLNTDGAPYLTNSLGTFLVATFGRTPIPVPSDFPEPDPLSTSRIHAYSSSDGLNWDFAKVVPQSQPWSEGPAIAGSMSDLIVADADNATETAVYFGNLTASREIRTRTQGLISATFGPKGNGDLRDIEITFIRFKRGGPPASNVGATEDVTLEVEHRSTSGQQIKWRTPWTLASVTMNQGHHFNEGLPQQDPPTFRVLMQPGETLRISITGDDGTVSKDVSYAQLLANPGFNGERRVSVDIPAQNHAYDVWYSRSVTTP